MTACSLCDDDRWLHSTTFHSCLSTHAHDCHFENVVALVQIGWWAFLLLTVIQVFADSLVRLLSAISSDYHLAICQNRVLTSVFGLEAILKGLGGYACWRR
jgi:hypothetical protein